MARNHPCVVSVVTAVSVGRLPVSKRRRSSTPSTPVARRRAEKITRHHVHQTRGKHRTNPLLYARPLGVQFFLV